MKSLKVFHTHACWRCRKNGQNRKKSFTRTCVGNNGLNHKKSSTRRRVGTKSNNGWARKKCFIPLEGKLDLFPVTLIDTSGNTERGNQGRGGGGGGGGRGGRELEEEEED